MIREEVIAQSLSITRIGQRKYFQVSLPRDTKRIIGLEYGAIKKQGEPASFMPPPVTLADPVFWIYADKIIGKLMLRAGRMFYQADLIEYRNIHLGETIIFPGWEPKPWTHGGRMEEIELSVLTDTALIEGFFQDSWGQGEFETLSYQLHLYLWIEKNICP